MCVTDSAGFPGVSVLLGGRQRVSVNESLVWTGRQFTVVVPGQRHGGLGWDLVVV